MSSKRVSPVGQALDSATCECSLCSWQFSASFVVTLSLSVPRDFGWSEPYLGVGAAWRMHWGWVASSGNFS